MFDRGVWRFPSWQFDPEGPDETIDGLPEVLQQILHISTLAKLRRDGSGFPILNNGIEMGTTRYISIRK